MSAAEFQALAAASKEVTPAPWLPGKPIDFDARYEEAAEHCAKQGFWHPMLVKALVGGLLRETLEDIECCPQAFEQRVREYMYGMSMEQVEACAATNKATGAAA